MLMSYNECFEKYGNQYQINKMIACGKLFKLATGVYSDKQVSELAVISYKYPQAVFTMNSAFYYHSLTDVIPDKYYLATSKDANKIANKNIKQFFYRDDKFNIGVTTINYQNTDIRIYDQERMLIELIRNKNTLPFDYYKEIIESYRNIIQDMDIEKLQEYIVQFPKQNYIMESIQLEVF